MVAYGDTDSVARMLESSTPAGFSEALTQEIEAERETVSREIDDATGRSWGVAGTSETRTIRTRPYLNGNLLILPTPARTVTAITVNMTDEAGVLTDGTLLTSSQWTIGLTDNEGNITALLIGGGGAYWNGSYWSGWGNSWISYGTVTITGTWADTGVDITVPGEINSICNTIVARKIAKGKASPAGFVGQDGTVVPILDAWKDPDVKRILRKYELVTHGLVL